jgi:hypothetical protein
MFFVFYHQTMLCRDAIKARAEDYKFITKTDVSKEIEGVFRQLNAVDGTELCCRLRVRSMSVGDVLVDAETKVGLFCAPMGWEPLSEGVVGKLLALAMVPA